MWSHELSEWLYIYCVFTKESVGFWCGDWEEVREKETKKIHLSDFLLFWKEDSINL